MTGTPDGNLPAPTPEIRAAATRPATAPPAVPQHRQGLVIMLPGEVDITNDGQVHDTLTLEGDVDEETYPALIGALSQIPGTTPACCRPVRRDFL